MKKHFFPVVCAAALVFVLAGTGCKKNKTEVQSQQFTQQFPQHIVSLSPASTEILFAIEAGNQITAVSEFCDYPAEAAEKPVVGGFDGKTISLERILSFKPDLVYLTDGMHNFLIDQLNQYDIKFYLSKADSIESVKKEILEVGKLTGHEKKAELVVKDIENDISTCKAAENSISVYYEVWNSPYISAGSKSFINDIIDSAGGTNIFSDLEEAYPIVSEETLISRKPEIILIPASSGISTDSIGSRAGWNSIPGVVNNRVYVIDDNLITRPGPRIGQGVKYIHNLIK